MSAYKEYLEATSGLTKAQQRLLRRLGRAKGYGLSTRTIYARHHDQTISSLKGRRLIRFDGATRQIRLTRMGIFWATGG
jgi:hypothetical protein